MARDKKADGTLLHGTFPPHFIAVWGAVVRHVQVREAVGAMLMLSWVRHLVKTPSLFSSVSALLDPELEVSLTHKPDKYLQFPENGMPTTAQYLADMQQE